MAVRLPLLLAALLATPPATVPRLLASRARATCGTDARDVILYDDGTIITGESGAGSGPLPDRATRLVRACETRTLRLNRRGLSLDTAPMGDVSVTGWDRDYVEVVVRLAAAARTEVEALQLLADTRVETAPTVRAVVPAERAGGTRRRWVVADFEVRAPRSTALELTTHVGDISLSDVGGPVRARTATGDVRARVGRVWGGLDAETSTGAIDVAVPAGFSAAVRARTTLGAVRAEGLPLAGAVCDGRSCVGALGSGGVTLRASTTTGDVVLRRR